MDPFSRIGLPRKLDLNASELEEELRQLAKSAHPDAGGDAEEFSEISKAGDLLKVPVSRLKVALELSGADLAGRGSVPAEIMDLFSPVAAVLEEVRSFVSERERARSVLGKAVLDAQVPVLKRKLEELTTAVGDLEERQRERFPEFDQRGWENCLAEMEEAYRALLFLGKWMGQLREATGKIFEALLAG